jgi:ElaB/YqjD/DUF883 family membrane-anchored ribosome-binding protein
MSKETDSAAEKTGEAVEKGLKKAGEKVDEAREKFGEVATSVKEKARQAKETAGRKGEELRETAGKASEAAKVKYDAAVEGLREGYGKVRKDFDHLVDDVNAYVRDNPGRSVLMAAGLGFVVGLLLRGGRHRD